MRHRIALAVTAAALVLAAPAAAHVTVSPESAPAADYAMLQFTVPHGCDGSATSRLRVQIPESVPSATPQVHPGWSLRTKNGPKEEAELHGETITKGVSEVIWTAEEAPLPDGRVDVFGIQARMPEAEGEPLYFPAIQECEQGETGWIQIPTEGESSEELDEPAPAVTLTAAGGSADGGSSGDDPELASAEAEVAAADDGSDDDGAPMGLAVLGIVLGGLGLVAGGASLVRSRHDG